MHQQTKRNWKTGLKSPCVTTIGQQRAKSVGSLCLLKKNLKTFFKQNFLYLLVTSTSVLNFPRVLPIRQWYSPAPNNIFWRIFLRLFSLWVISFLNTIFLFLLSFLKLFWFFIRRGAKCQVFHLTFQLKPVNFLFLLIFPHS